jgi:hypothetical protein
MNVAYAYVRMRTLLGTNFIHIRDLKVFPVIGWCPVNVNILAPKLGALWSSRPKQNDSFLEKGCCDYDYILPIYADHLPK